MMSRTMPLTPVAAPWNGWTAGWLWLDLEGDRSALARVMTPAFSPILTMRRERISSAAFARTRR